MRRRVGLAGVAALALALPAAATAADLPAMGKDIAYRVEVAAVGKYQYSEHVDQGPPNWYGHDVDLELGYSGDINDGVVFRNAAPFDTTADDLSDGVAIGTYTPTGNPPGDPACDATSDDPTHGWMRFLSEADLPGELIPLDEEVHLWLRPFDMYDVGFECGRDEHPGVSLAMPFGDDAHYEDGTVKFGRNPFDIAFTLPRDIIGMGYIEQVVPLHVFEQERCPHYVDVHTTACHLEWSAKIKLTKLWEKPIEASTPPPQPAPLELPELVPLVPPPPKPVPEPDEDGLIPLVPAAKASLSANAAKASFAVSCAGGCTGTAALTAGTGAKASAAANAKTKAKALARASFKVAKGQTKRVTLKLNAKARRAVKKARGARIVVRTVAGGKATTKTLRLKLPKRPARR